ncbi:MAG TPA: histidine kinase [Pyrinomonadaceae bacterium]|nr:histidine kinase [Pyrinomonadaceae bacterium]
MTEEVPVKDPSAILPLSELSFDVRMISAMRVILACSALLVTVIDPSEPDELVFPTYLALTGYVIYSGVIYILAIRHSRMLPGKILHWLDIAWYLALIAVSSGTNSIFFFFFFFAMLVASFGWGFSEGLRVTLVSAVLFTIVGYATGPDHPELQLDRLLLRPIQLLVLGYMIAFWGRIQSSLKARLGLLKEVSLVSNPRFGVERTVRSVLESLRSSYGAETCLLILPKSQSGQPIRLYGSSSEGTYNLYRVDPNTEDPPNAPSEITEEVARSFLPASPTQAIIYRRKKPAETLMYDTKSGGSTKVDSRTLPFVNAFEGKSCFSVPVYYRGQPVGRLFIVGGPYRFNYADIDFVLQVMEQVTGVLENIRLVDSLASDAAGQERRKIAQDIHDSVIQPYIGLQFGLTSVKQKLQNGEDALTNVEELLKLTTGEIEDLRSYVGGLRRGESPRDIFLPAVRRFAAKFSEATGLNVEIRGRDDLPVYDRLAAELFQMIEEGLSNVRRHSTSTYAKLEIAINDGHLEMQLRNERLKRLGEASFTPRSIADRAAALGGRTVVYTDKNHDTVVAVQIPL